jgi:hypothetical protein
MALPLLSMRQSLRKNRPRNACCGPRSSIVSKRRRATAFDEPSSVGRSVCSLFPSRNALERLVAAYDKPQGLRSTSTCGMGRHQGVRGVRWGKHWHKCRTCGAYFECNCNNRARVARYCNDCTRLRQRQTVVDAALFQVLRNPITRN